MRPARGALVLAVSACLTSVASAYAQPAPGCSRTVVFTLPAVTWELVDAVSPPAVLAAAHEGAVGSISTRTNDARPSYSSGFATLGAGARADGVPPQSSAAGRAGDGSLESNVIVGTIDEMRALAAQAGYHARPGALASALGQEGVTAIGNGDLELQARAPETLNRPVLLAAMNERGRVARASTGPPLLRSDPSAPGGVRTDAAALRRALELTLENPCATVVVDHGDLMRADALDGDPAALATALRSADASLAVVMNLINPRSDTLIIASVTPPAAEPAHLGVAIALGPGYPAGATLESPTTRRSGIVTLVDIAPTVLWQKGVDIPPWMLGRPLVPRPSDDPGGRIAAAIDLDRESMFAYRLQPRLLSGFVAVQILFYIGGAYLLARARSPGRAGSWTQAGALAVVSFPLASYLARVFSAHEMGGVLYTCLLIAVDAGIVALLMTLSLSPLERLLVSTGVTVCVLAADLVWGGALQLNALFGNYPVVGGRFAGLGNTGFAVLGAAALLFGVLLVQLLGPRPWALAGAGLVFAAAIVLDGAPQLGSDVGGVFALVPSLGITYALLWKRRPGVRLMVGMAAVAIILLGAFIAIDLSRPPEVRTHLGRLAESVAERGLEPVTDTVGRKIRSNLGVFSLSPFSFSVLPLIAALAVVTWRWRELSSRLPFLRSGIFGLLILAIL
ncbi:MAG: hypothetical protein H0V97_00480, partial [Actinobacteria bacterium]|nr:hypothetical protein [Actinomycetota bacterium]